MSLITWAERRGAKRTSGCCPADQPSPVRAQERREHQGGLSVRRPLTVQVRAEGLEEHLGDRNEALVAALAHPR